MQEGEDIGLESTSDKDSDSDDAAATPISKAAKQAKDSSLKSRTSSKKAQKKSNNDSPAGRDV
jgi:hypothetical protein